MSPSTISKAFYYEGNTMTKREAVLDLVVNGTDPGFKPAAFFLHFPEGFKGGMAAVEKHIEYFRYTDMDLVKIQYEKPFPRIDTIRKPSDWATMPFYELGFYQDQIEAVQGLVDELGEEALVVVTLYSPFMSAVHTVGADVLGSHLLDDPESVCKGFEIITESMLGFVRACADVGVDGFYASTQGGEAARFANPAIFADYIKPYDMVIWERIDALCDFNILHVCDYHDTYANMEPYIDYPGEIINCSLQLTDRSLKVSEVIEMFGRPYMGGMDRHGILANGSHEQIRNRAFDILDANPDISILGADCTLPADIDWDNIKAAIDAAHSFQQE